MATTKPCTIGKRHKWTFVNNQTVTSGTLTTIRLSLKGLYRCECGEKKFGEPEVTSEPK